MGGVEVRGGGISEQDFLSWSFTTTGDNLTSVEGSVIDVVDGVPSTVRQELDRRQLSDRDAGELLCTKSRCCMPFGVEGNGESRRCGDEKGDPVYSRKFGSHVDVLRRTAGGRYFSTRGSRKAWPGRTLISLRRLWQLYE